MVLEDRQINISDMFIPRELSVIGGRPGMGKTAFMLSVAERLANAGTPVHIVISNGQRDSISFIIDKQGLDISSRPINLHECKRMTIPAIHNIASTCEKNAVIFIDYLQLVELDDKKTTTSEKRNMKEIVQKIKEIAVETNHPIVILSQLRRGLEYRNDKHPTLNDLKGLKDYSCISNALFIYRPSYYDFEVDRELAQLTISMPCVEQSTMLNIKWKERFLRYEL